jgi:hypothetical protein
MIDLKTINENLAKANEDVAFWEKARVLFLDPRMAQAASTQLTALPTASPVGSQVRPYGELKRRVLESLPEWGERPLNTNSLVEKMEQSGYVFSSKTPPISVNEALVALEAEGSAFMVEKIGVARFWTKSQLEQKNEFDF